MMDTRVKVEGLIGPNQSLLEYYEREDGVTWCLTEDKENYNILRIEGDDVDPWVSFTFENDAQDSFNNIVQEFTAQEVPGRAQGETPKLKSVELSTLEKINRSKFGKLGHTLVHEATLTLATMENDITGEKYLLYIEGKQVRDTYGECAPKASIAELIDTVTHLLNKTDLLDCGRYYYEEGPFTHWDKMTSTERICAVYDLFIKSSKKQECLELVASRFFQAMIDDIESCEARESLDYLLSLLSK